MIVKRHDTRQSEAQARFQYLTCSCSLGSPVKTCGELENTKT